MMTPAQRRTLRMLREEPLTPIGLTIYRIHRRTMHALQDLGYVKYRPYGKPPSWAITREGRAALDNERRTTK